MNLKFLRLDFLREIVHEAVDGRSAHAPGDVQGDLARYHVIKLAFERMIDRKTFSERLIHTDDRRLLRTEDFPDVTDDGECPFSRHGIGDEESNVSIAEVRKDSAAIVERPADHRSSEFTQHGRRPLCVP